MLSSGAWRAPNASCPEGKPNQFVTHDTEDSQPKLVKDTQSPDFERSNEQKEEREVVQLATEFLLEAVLPSLAIVPIGHACILRLIHIAFRHPNFTCFRILDNAIDSSQVTVEDRRVQ